MLWAFVLAFLNAEYRIALVDFICSSRGRLKRDRGFANPLSLSNTSPDPFGDPLRRGITATAVDRDIGFRYPVQTVCLHFDMTFGCFVFGLVSLAFQSGCPACIVRFSLLGGRSFVPAATWGFCFFYRRICADRDWIVSFGWKRYVIICIVRGLDCMGYPFS